MSRPLGPFVRLPTSEEVEAQARAGAALTLKQAPHGQVTTDAVLRLQRRAATEREALSSDSSRAAELPRGRGVGSPAQLGPERDARSVVDKIGGDLGEPGSWTSQGRRPSAVRATDFVGVGPRSRAVSPTGRAPVAPPGARGQEAGRAQVPLSPGGAPQRRPRTPGGVPDDGGVGRIREVLPGQGPNVDLSTGSKGGPTPHAFALEPGALRDPRQVPTLTTTPEGVTEFVAQPPWASATDFGARGAMTPPAGTSALSTGAGSEQFPAGASSAVAPEGGLGALSSGRAQGASTRASVMGSSPAVARDFAFQVGVRVLARAQGVAPGGTRTGPLTDEAPPGAGAGVAGESSAARSGEPVDLPVPARGAGGGPGGPGSAPGAGQARGKGGGGLVESLLQQERVAETGREVLSEKASALNESLAVLAGAKTEVARLRTADLGDAQKAQALAVANDAVEQAEGKNAEAYADWLQSGEAVGAAQQEAYRLEQAVLAQNPSDGEKRIAEARARERAPAARHRRQRDAVVGNRLAGAEVRRAQRRYGAYVARNASTAAAKHLALGAVAAQARGDWKSRKQANSDQQAVQDALAKRARVTKNGPALDESGKRLTPLTQAERRELAQLRADEPKRRQEDARLKRSMKSAESRRDRHALLHGKAILSDLRGTAGRSAKELDKVAGMMSGLADRDPKREQLKATYLALFGAMAVANQAADRLEHFLRTGEWPKEGGEPPVPAEPVPPGCPPDYETRCCDCPPGTTCVCPGGAGGDRGAPPVGPRPGVMAPDGVTLAGADEPPPPNPPPPDEPAPAPEPTRGPTTPEPGDDIEADPCAKARRRIESAMLALEFALVDMLQTRAEMQQDQTWVPGTVPGREKSGDAFGEGPKRELADMLDSQINQMEESLQYLEMIASGLDPKNCEQLASDAVQALFVGPVGNALAGYEFVATMWIGFAQLFAVMRQGGARGLSDSDLRTSYVALAKLVALQYKTWSLSRLDAALRAPVLQRLALDELRALRQYLEKRAVADKIRHYLQLAELFFFGGRVLLAGGRLVFAGIRGLAAVARDPQALSRALSSVAEGTRRLWGVRPGWLGGAPASRTGQSITREALAGDIRTWMERASPAQREPLRVLRRRYVEELSRIEELQRKSVSLRASLRQQAEASVLARNSMKALERRSMPHALRQRLEAADASAPRTLDEFVARLRSRPGGMTEEDALRYVLESSRRSSEVVNKAIFARYPGD